MTTVIHARWVCPASRPPIGNGAVVVEGDRIVDVVDRASDPDVSYPSAALIPGFVNVHTHLELSVLRGLLEDLSFPDWIRTLTRTKYELMDEGDLLVSARLGALECLRAGVTTIGEVFDVGAGWRAMCDAGLSGIAYQEVFGPDRDAAGTAMAGLEAKIDAIVSEATPLRRLGVSPHAPYTVSDDLFGRVREFARRRDLPVAVHVAESGDEVAFVSEGKGTFARRHRDRGIGVTARGVGPIEYLDGLGVLDQETLAIHAIMVDAASIRRLADRNVAVAHCPKSNLKLGHRIAPVAAFLAAGLRVGLGTDSVASNNSVDMFEEMRTAVFLQRSKLGNPRAMRAESAFVMATLGGARCLGLAGDLGSLDAGKKANMTVVELDRAALTPVYDPVDTLVFSACRADVSAVYIDGERVGGDGTGITGAAAALARRLAADLARFD